MPDDPRRVERPGLIVFEHPNDGEPTPPPPRKYTKGLHDSICRTIRAGHHPETAAEMCGLSAIEFREWLRRGNDGDPTLAQFASDTQNAAAWAEADVASKVYEAAKSDAAIGLKWLERQRPKKWNKTYESLIQSDITKLMNLLEQRCSRNTYIEVLRVLAEATGSGETPPRTGD